MGTEMMTPDEVVAARVRDLIADRGLSTGMLAERLGVGEHQARDMQRPRRGRPQRSFAWAELVMLCVVLDTSLFELVLPPEDVTVTGHRGIEVPPDAHGIREAFYRSAATASRDGFARDIFGFPHGDFTPKFLSGVLDIIGKARGEREAELESEIEKLAVATREWIEAHESLRQRLLTYIEEEE